MTTGQTVEQQRPRSNFEMCINKADLTEQTQNNVRSNHTQSTAGRVIQQLAALVLVCHFLTVLLAIFHSFFGSCCYWELINRTKNSYSHIATHSH